MQKHNPLIFCTLFVVVFVITNARASESSVLESVDWLSPTNSIKTQKDGGLAGDVLPADETNPVRLKLSLSDETKCIAIFKQPNIRTNQYAIKGRIRYKNVTQAGYVEMLHHTPTETYFSKTVSNNRGPMGEILGDSEWRDFVTPMNLLGGSAPRMVELNVVFPGTGEIEIASLELIDGPANDLHSDAWWSDRTSGLLGGILGSAIGIGGGLCGWLTGRGKARWFVSAYYFATVALGIACLIAGFTAIALKQPYGVWYLLTIIGVIVTLTSGVGIRASSQRYAADELRRMNARDSE